MQCGSIHDEIIPQDSLLYIYYNYRNEELILYNQEYLNEGWLIYIIKILE